MGEEILRDVGGLSSESLGHPTDVSAGKGQQYVALGLRAMKPPFAHDRSESLEMYPPCCLGAGGQWARFRAPLTYAPNRRCTDDTHQNMFASPCVVILTFVFGAPARAERRRLAPGEWRPRPRETCRGRPIWSSFFA